MNVYIKRKNSNCPYNNIFAYRVLGCGGAAAHESFINSRIAYYSCD